ncbi:MAG: response regulator transcription factor [Spirochaetales bacterium]|nr:response regulator transcription factor [Spirochaetales bacterium]
MKKNYSVYIIDRQPVVRKGLSTIITEVRGFDICGDCSDTKNVYESIEKLNPDIIILDIALKEGSGIEFIKDLKVRFPEIHILVFSHHDESIYADHVLRAGALGYIMKDEEPDKIKEAIKYVLKGEIFVSEKIRLKLLKRLISNKPKPYQSPMEQLSSRELEVFQLIGAGLSTRKIASELNLGIKTIETYRFNIKKKLGISDNTELIHHASKWFFNENKGKFQEEI